MQTIFVLVIMIIKVKNKMVKRKKGRITKEKIKMILALRYDAILNG